MQLFVLHETKSVINYSIPIFGLISCLFSILHISLPCLLFGVKPLFWPSFSPIIISVRFLILLYSCIRSSSFFLSFFAPLPLLPSEVQSCQRAYFYQRFPFLHVDSGDHFLMYSFSFFFCLWFPSIYSFFFSTKLSLSRSLFPWSLCSVLLTSVYPSSCVVSAVCSAVWCFHWTLPPLSLSV